MCIIPQHAKERKKKHKKDRKKSKKNTLFQWIMLLTIYVKCQTPALLPNDYNFIVTPKEIDELIENMSSIVARGINMAV